MFSISAFNLFFIKAKLIFISIKKNNNLIKYIIKYINLDVKLKSSFYHHCRIYKYDSSKVFIFLKVKLTLADIPKFL